MKICEVKNIRIGEGKPKICIPIVGRDNEDIIKQASSLENLSYDMIELRIDFYQDIKKIEEVLSLLEKVRLIIQKPILLTYRSLREGGEVQLDDEIYLSLITHVCESHLVDLIDIELMSGDVLVHQLVDIAHQNEIKVIMSNHDFEKTPDKEDMKQRIEKMEQCNADILKLAVMPQSYQDVMNLMNVTFDMSQKVNRPIVTMSMGDIGKITRICGELTGSSITFATAGKASAPGQIALEDMQLLLEAIHHD